jgi:hypothetical protein
MFADGPAAPIPETFIHLQKDDSRAPRNGLARRFLMCYFHAGCTKVLMSVLTFSDGLIALAHLEAIASATISLGLGAHYAQTRVVCIMRYNASGTGNKDAVIPFHSADGRPLVESSP